MTTQTLDVAEGIARMEEAIEAIEKSINEQEGFFKLKVKVCPIARLPSILALSVFLSI